MSGPAIFIGVGVAIALAALLSGLVVRQTTEADRSRKRAKYLTWWIRRQDRLKGEQDD